jgi:hypothetical protein
MGIFVNLPDMNIKEDEALQYATWRVEEIEVPVWTGAV